MYKFDFDQRVYVHSLSGTTETVWEGSIGCRWMKDGIPYYAVRMKESGEVEDYNEDTLSAMPGLPKVDWF